MAAGTLPEALSGFTRIKWWRYRYILVALLLTNAFVIHYFFVDRSISSLTPFHSSPDVSNSETYTPPTDSKHNAAEDAHDHEPVGNPTEAGQTHEETESTKPAEGGDKSSDQEQVDNSKSADGDKSPTTGEGSAGEGESKGEQDEKKPDTDAEKLKDAPKPDEPPKTEEPPPPPPKPPLAVPSYAPVKFVPPPASKGAISLSNYDFNGEYTGWPLERVCKEATYTDGLYYVCDNNSGGIGNIRNFILTCIRYAIEAGAQGIIMPKIQRRSEEELGVLFTSSFQPFSYFFDEEHFRTVMGKFCPQLKIYDSLDALPHKEGLFEAKEFYPKALNSNDGLDDRGRNRHLDQFRDKHDKWLHKYHRMPNATAPVSVRFRWATFFEWPIYRDGPEFATTFGDVLRLRKDLEEIAASIIDELVSLVNGKPTKSNRKELNAPYLGVHLRTEADALGFWPDFDTQALGYLEQAGTRGLKFAYIASGDAKEGHKFGDLAMEHLGMKVVGKTDLLKGEALARLQKFTWDQQALVDFLVLSKSAHFTGCSFSSFSMNIAIKRHTMTEGITSRLWKSPGDAYSTLVGRFDNWYGDWMFMYECMWP